MAHPEAVLFIDNQQAQIFPAHVVLQQLMGADENINFAFRCLLQHQGLFFGATKARQQLNAHRPVGKTVAEIVEMLLRQQSSGHQHRHLLIVFYRQKRRTHCHFGLAKTHVTADQTIHG